jgi:hypothetical protein
MYWIEASLSGEWKQICSGRRKYLIGENVVVLPDKGVLEI